MDEKPKVRASSERVKQKYEYFYFRVSDGVALSEAKRPSTIAHHIARLFVVWYNIKIKNNPNKKWENLRRQKDIIGKTRNL